MIHNLNRRHGTRVTNLSASVAESLQEHNWPGNVRELRNVVERALIVASEGPIKMEHLRLDTSNVKSTQTQRVQQSNDSLTLPAGWPLSRAEDAYIQLTLKHVNNNRREAAAALGISLRTLQTRLAEIRSQNKLAGQEEMMDDSEAVD